MSDEMSDEIKPCWRCGSSKVDWYNDDGILLCECGNMIAEMSHKDAIGWWNTRAIEDALRIENALLQASINAHSQRCDGLELALAERMDIVDFLRAHVDSLKRELDDSSDINAV